MAGTGTITARQEALIAALLGAASLAHACRQTGVPERTARRWLTEPPFAAAYRGARQDTLDQALGRVQALAHGAVAVLQQVMLDETTPPAVRVQAAGKILDLAVKAGDTDRLEDRIAALETALAGDLGPRAVA